MSAQSIDVNQVTPDGVTDWYLDLNDLGKSFIYIEGRKGAVPLPSHLEHYATRLLNVAKVKYSPNEDRHDFRVELDDGSFCRIRHQKVHDVELMIFRRIRRQVPKPETLGLPMDVVRILTSPKYAPNGGLTLFVGETGSGKTTTCASLTQARLERGVYALTVEAPIEYSLQGPYPSGGLCYQIETDEEGFARTLKDVLRCFPAAQRETTLMVGEILNAETLSHALRAALAGQFVLSTFHASDVITAVARLLSMASFTMGEADAREVLAICLRGVVHQKIIDGKLQTQSLFSPDASHSVANIIREGMAQHLVSGLNQQTSKVEQHTLFTDILGKV